MPQFPVGRTLEGGDLDINRVQVFKHFPDYAVLTGRIERLENQQDAELLTRIKLSLMGSDRLACFFLQSIMSSGAVKFRGGSLSVPSSGARQGLLMASINRSINPAP